MHQKEMFGGMESPIGLTLLHIALISFKKRILTKGMFLF